MKKALLFFLFAGSFQVGAQNLAAFSDFRNYFYAFDAGFNRQLEHNRVKSFKVGGSMIAYLDYLENFKVYYKGTSQLLENIPIGSYEVTDYLVGYTLGIGSELYVVDAGKQKLLTTRSGYRTVSDSTLLFYDYLSQSLKAYYKGKIHELEFVNDDPKDYKATDNVIAFISRTNELRVFYAGEIFPLLLIDDAINYQAGKNIVPYLDGYTSTFKAFYKGNTYELETIQPVSFKTGDDLVAWETNDWAFKVFYDGKVIQLSDFNPTFYAVVDSLVLYQEFNQFKVFYKGEIHTLENNFVPKDYQVAFGMLVYRDVQNRLTAFYNGKKQVITYDIVSDYKLFRNAVHYRSNNSNFVFWKGKVY